MYVTFIYLRPVSLLSPSNVCLSNWGLAPDNIGTVGLSCRVNDRAVRAGPFAHKAFRVNYTQLYRAYA